MLTPWAAELNNVVNNEGKVVINVRFQFWVQALINYNFQDKPRQNFNLNMAHSRPDHIQDQI